MRLVEKRKKMTTETVVSQWIPIITNTAGFVSNARLNRQLLLYIITMLISYIC